jgi:hypothetical protein
MLAVVENTGYTRARNTMGYLLSDFQIATITLAKMVAIIANVPIVVTRFTIGDSKTTSLHYFLSTASRSIIAKEKALCT